MNFSSHKATLPFNFIVSVVSELAAAGDLDRWRGDLERDRPRSRGAGDLDRGRGLRRGERERRGLRRGLRRGERAWRELDFSVLSRDRRGDDCSDVQGKGDCFDPCSEACLAKTFCALRRLIFKG